MRTLIVIDEANLTTAARLNYNKRIEWVKFGGWLEGNHNVVDTVVFTGVPPVTDSNKFLAARQGKLNFIEFLQAKGFLVYTREGIAFTPTSGVESYSANADILITMQTLIMLQRMRIDKLILVTGDGGFSDFVLQLREWGITVDVVFTLQNTAGVLRRSASRFVNIEPILLEMESYPETREKESYINHAE